MGSARDSEGPLRLEHAAMEPDRLVAAWVWLIDLHFGPVERVAHGEWGGFSRWLDRCVLDVRHGRRPMHLPRGQLGSTLAEYTRLVIAAAWASGLDGRSLPPSIDRTARELGYRTPRAFADVLATCDAALRLVQRHFPQLYPPVNRQPSIDAEMVFAELQTEVLAQRRRAQLILRDPERSGQHAEALRSIRDGWRRLRQRPKDALLAGRYQLFEPPIGIGSMAAVWRAFDLDSQIDVAIRQMLREHVDGFFGGDGPTRFLEGHRLLLSLRSKGLAVAEVYSRSVESDGGRDFYAMRLYARNLYVDARKLRWWEAVKLVVDVGRTLGQLHELGILHRDIKPSNILIDDDGRPVITDFDLYHAVDQTAGTTAGVGTSDYLAPELLAAIYAGQTGDELPYSVASDVYALAMTLAHVLLGCDPLQIRGGIGAMLAALPGEAAISLAVHEALDADPARRTPSCAALCEPLQRVLAAFAERAEEIEAGFAAGVPRRLSADGAAALREAVAEAPAFGVAVPDGMTEAAIARAVARHDRGEKARTRWQTRRESRSRIRALLAEHDPRSATWVLTEPQLAALQGALDEAAGQHLNLIAPPSVDEMLDARLRVLASDGERLAWIAQRHATHPQQRRALEARALLVVDRWLDEPGPRLPLGADQIAQLVPEGPRRLRAWIRQEAWELALAAIDHAPPRDGTVPPWLPEALDRAVNAGERSLSEALAARHGADATLGAALARRAGELRVPLAQAMDLARALTGIELPEHGNDDDAMRSLVDLARSYQSQALERPPLAGEVTQLLSVARAFAALGEPFHALGDATAYVRAWRQHLLAVEEVRFGSLWAPIAELAVFAGDYELAERIWTRTMSRAQTIILDNHNVSPSRRGNRDEERFWEWWSTYGAQERDEAYVEGPAWWLAEAFSRRAEVARLRASQGATRCEWQRLRWIADAVSRGAVRA